MESPASKREARAEVAVPKLTLTYFDFGGRSAAPRLALAYAGIPLEFETIPWGKWDEWKLDASRFPTEDIPVLRIGDKRVVTQSAAISQYCGLLAGLWPSDPEGAAVNAEIFATVEEIYTSFFGTCMYKTLPMFNAGVSDEEFAKRQADYHKHLLFYARRVNDIIACGKNRFAAGDSLSVADFYVWQLPQLDKTGEVGKMECIARITKLVDDIDQPGFATVRAKVYSAP